MKFKQFLDDMNKFVKENPKTLDVMKFNDVKRNGFEFINRGTPEIGYFNRLDSEYVSSLDGDFDEIPNVIVIA